MIHNEIFDKFSSISGFENIIFNNTMNTKFQTRSAWILFNNNENCELAIDILKNTYGVDSS